MLVEHEGRAPRVDPATVLGTERGASEAEATGRCAELFGRHRNDTVVV